MLTIWEPKLIDYILYILLFGLFNFIINYKRYIITSFAIVISFIICSHLTTGFLFISLSSLINGLIIVVIKRKFEEKTIFTLETLKELIIILLFIFIIKLLFASFIIPFALEFIGYEKLIEKWSLGILNMESNPIETGPGLGVPKNTEPGLSGPINTEPGLSEVATPVEANIGAVKYKTATGKQGKAVFNVDNPFEISELIESLVKPTGPWGTLEDGKKILPFVAEKTSNTVITGDREVLPIPIREGVQIRMYTLNGVGITSYGNRTYTTPGGYVQDYYCNGNLRARANIAYSKDELPNKR